MGKGGQRYDTSFVSALSSLSFVSMYGQARSFLFFVSLGINGSRIVSFGFEAGMQADSSPFLYELLYKYTLKLKYL